MFEKYVDNRDHRRRRWLLFAIFSSVLVHVSLVAFLLVSALWHLDKLSAEQRPVYYAATVGPPSVVLGGSPPPPKAETKRAKKPRTDRLTQPSRDSGEPSEEQSLTLSDEDPGYGVPDGVPGSTGTDPFGTGVTGTGTPGPGPVGEIDLPPPPAPKKPKPPEIVPAKLIEGSLIYGDPQIRPPDDVRSAMQAASQSQLVTAVQMCLDRRGHVSRLHLIKSSGYPAYDQRILDEMRDWRYRPYEVNDQPIPICTAITFLYRMR